MRTPRAILAHRVRRARGRTVSTATTSGYVVSERKALQHLPQIRTSFCGANVCFWPKADALTRLTWTATMSCPKPRRGRWDGANSLRWSEAWQCGR